MSVRRSLGSKLGDQLSVGLEDEDAAGLVVHGDDVSVLVHGHTFRPHQTTGSDFVLTYGNVEKRNIERRKKVVRNSLCSASWCQSN